VKETTPKKKAAPAEASPIDAGIDSDALGIPSSAADRSLRLLSLLAKEGRALALAELATRLNIPKGTLHRLCSQLLESKHLSRDLDQRFYSVGPALRTLAFDALNNGVERGLRHAILDALVTEVRETCNFTTLDGAQVLYLDRVEAAWPLRLHLDIGSRVPMHCTASGKLFLAMMKESEREKMMSNLPMMAFTNHTLTDREALNKECNAIARRGYSTDREEFMAGLVAIATPVLDTTGAIRAAIAIHAPTARMSLNEALTKLPALRKAAKSMQALI
jgi:IclR family transcriptional regulator, acetate operon repressor